MIQTAQPLGAVSSLDDDRDLGEGGHRYQRRISGFESFDEGAPFRFALLDGDESRAVDDRSARQTLFVIADGGESTRTAHPCQAIAERPGDRLRLGLPSLPGQFCGPFSAFRMFRARSIRVDL
jgi:hypothetical protein